jgi:predicted RNA binding protein YcfA (HicA-like mRNA interferase family)
MRLPRDLSGREPADALCRHWGYHEIHQVGSHISIVTETPTHQRIAIPAHKHLKVGMLNGILRCVASHKGATRQMIGS